MLPQVGRSVRNADTLSKADFVSRTELAIRTAERLLKKFLDFDRISL